MKQKIHTIRCLKKNQELATASSYQGILFTDGATLWGWNPPSFFND